LENKSKPVQVSRSKKLPHVKTSVGFESEEGNQELRLPHVKNKSKQPSNELKTKLVSIMAVLISVKAKWMTSAIVYVSRLQPCRRYEIG
jgi:hypothetical protein